MSLLQQLSDGCTFDVFIAGENLCRKVLIKGGKKMKITACQILAVWRMVQSFLTEILDQVSRFSCRAQGASLCRRITASLRRLGPFLLLACQSFLAWRNFSAVNVSPCSRKSTGRTTDEPCKTVASTLQADCVTLNSFPWLIAN